MRAADSVQPRRRTALLMMLALVAGCAQPPVRAPGEGLWSGRLSLRVDGNPVRLWHASFQLTGAPEAGALTLYAPLGATLARATWAPGGAELVSNDERRAYADTDALTADLLGEAIPMAALFAWLSMTTGPALGGWEVDASQRERGILRAQRAASAQQPAALLTVALDR